MSDQERKRRSTASEMARLRQLCRERLFADWRENNVAPGAPLAGVRLLSERHQLPLSVIRNVLTELKNEGVIVGTARSAMTLRKLPPAPQTLAKRRIALIGEMDQTHPYVLYNTGVIVSQGMERLLNEQGGILEFLNVWSPDGHNRTGEILAAVHAGHFDAIILIDSNEALLPGLLAAGVPLVRIDGDSPLCHSVMFDEFDCGRRAGEHLLGLGHPRFAVAHYPEFERSCQRLAGARAACAEAGMPEPEVWEFRYFPDLMTVAEALDRHLGDCTAVFAVNDRLASMIVSLLGERGLRVPSDVSLIGCDDLPGLRSFNLTTVQRSYPELGLAAYELLKEELLNPDSERPFRKLRLQCPLLVRSSTASPAKLADNSGR